ncbi:MAG: CoA pyrophosphatase [Formosa sp.]|jgi:8-oxo-dGTP pyrophosphatase MutT (NUDIX family)|nr:CoA pyrophosphatase [Formosa sp.]|tara:strand:- start:352 stop:1005 length:654 start_codon:yes stop_codon:yes gene_type:complete
MRFKAFEKVIPEINKLSLPGLETQLKMAPSFRKKLIEEFKEARKTAKLAAVLCLFYPSDSGETNIVLILRKVYKGVHSAQVGFPGGKPENIDKSLMHTALRETWEEIGVASNKIKVIRQLTTIYIPPSNFQVYPFIGISHSPITFNLQFSEVEDIIEISLLDILNDDNEVRSEVLGANRSKYSVPAFKLNGHIIWGATAMILIEIKTMLNLVLKKIA